MSNTAQRAASEATRGAATTNTGRTSRDGHAASEARSAKVTALFNTGRVVLHVATSSAEALVAGAPTCSTDSHVQPRFSPQRSVTSACHQALRQRSWSAGLGDEADRRASKGDREAGSTRTVVTGKEETLREAVADTHDAQEESLGGRPRRTK